MKGWHTVLVNDFVGAQGSMKHGLAMIDQTKCEQLLPSSSTTFGEVHRIEINDCWIGSKEHDEKPRTQNLNGL